jgi:hypothetical protein
MGSDNNRVPLFKTGEFGKIGSVEIIVFYNVLGGFAPATGAAPLAISVENRFIVDIR